MGKKKAAPPPPCPWNNGSRTQAFFDSITQNLSGEAADVSRAIAHGFTTGAGRALLGGSAGLFGLFFKEAVDIVNTETGKEGGEGWVKSIEAHAEMTFQPMAAPQASDLAALSISSAGLMHETPRGTSEAVREPTVSELLAEDQALHLIQLDPYCTEVEFTRDPSKTTIREEELKVTVDRICSFIVTKFKSKKPGKAVCKELGRAAQERLRKLPDRGLQGSVVTRGSDRSIGDMVWNKFRNMKYVSAMPAIPLATSHLSCFSFLAFLHILLSCISQHKAKEKLILNVVDVEPSERAAFRLQFKDDETVCLNEGPKATFKNKPAATTDEVQRDPSVDRDDAFYTAPFNELDDRVKGRSDAPPSSFLHLGGGLVVPTLSGGATEEPPSADEAADDALQAALDAAREGRVNKKVDAKQKKEAAKAEKAMDALEKKKIEKEKKEAAAKEKKKANAAAAAKRKEERDAAKRPFPSPVKAPIEHERAENIKRNNNHLKELGLVDSGLVDSVEEKRKKQKESMKLTKAQKKLTTNYGLHVEVPCSVFPDEDPPPNGKYWPAVVVRADHLGTTADVAMKVEGEEDLLVWPTIEVLTWHTYAHNDMHKLVPVVKL
jgi:hypothetical protein